MTKQLGVLAIAVLAVAACSDAPTASDEQFLGELVITEGVSAPAYVPRVRPVFSDAAASASLGGSASTPLSLKPQSCDPGQSVVITFSITGNQAGTATFTVNSAWQYNGATWEGSSPVTVTVPPRVPSNPATIRMVTIAVVNASSVGSGTSQLIVAPGNLTNSNSSGAKLALTSESNAAVHVEFAECPVLNTAPTL